jgi:HlyD family secretion protein
LARPSRATLLAGAAALGLAGLAWLVFRPAPLRVETGRVDRGELRVTVDEEGETRVLERYVVAAPTTGHLLRITLDEGDAVEAGAVVARIEPVPLDPRDRAAAEARLEAAQASKRAADARVGQARAALEQARRTARRAERLFATGTLSEEAREEAELARTSAEREHEAALFAADAADHEVQAARAALIAAAGDAARAAADGDPRACAPNPCVEVRSPVAGRVLRVHEESDRIVAAGTPLLDLGDPSALEIVVDVLSTDAVRIEPGAPMGVEEWGGGRPLRAEVRRVEPSAFTKVSALGVEEQRVNVIGRLLEPAPSLGDGYRIEARIVVWEAPDVLRVPASALFRAGDDWAVFRVEDGVARRLPVEVGERSRATAEVRGGLAEGDAVVLHPSDRLSDGARVAPF